MLRRIFLTALAMVFMLVTICAAADMMQPKARVVNPDNQQVSTNGLKARIAVANFKWGVGRGGKTTIRDGDQVITVEQSGCMDGLRDMLVTALMESGKYVVLERGELSAIQEEMGLREKGYTDSTGVQRGNIKGADLLITGAITAWEPGTEGIGGGARIPIPFGRGGFSIGVKKAYLAMQVRIFDTATSEVLVSKKAQGEAKDFGFSTGARGFPLSGGLGMYKKTPMEKAINVCLDEVLKIINNNIPQQYCKY